MTEENNEGENPGKKNVEWTEAERKRLLFITLVVCVGMVLVMVFWT